MRVLIITAVFLLSSEAIFSQVSYIPFAMTVKEGGTEISLDTTYFNTTSIVNEDSVASSLAEGTSNQRLDFDFIGKYGLTDHLELMGGIRGRYIQAQFSFDPGTGSEDYTLSRSGAESGVVGLEYSLKEVEGTRYSVLGYYRKAFHSSSEFLGGEPTDVALGDDSREYGLGINFYYKTESANVLDAHIVYRSPGEDLSQEVFSRVQGAMVWKRVALYAGVENVFSFDADPYSNDPENKPAVLQGSSVQFNSVNRQWSAPYGGLSFGLGPAWRIGVEYAQVTTGRSTDLGQRLLINLTRRSEESDNSFAKRDSQFKQYRIEAVVQKMASSRKVAVVDKGIERGLNQGMRVDFYHFDFVGGNELIATGVVIKARASKSLVRITKRLSRKRVEEGTVARAGEIAGPE